MSEVWFKHNLDTYVQSATAATSCGCNPFREHRCGITEAKLVNYPVGARVVVALCEYGVRRKVPLPATVRATRIRYGNAEAALVLDRKPGVRVWYSVDRLRRTAQ